jgi:transcriptional regulator with XRE-family HTH domain
VQELAGLRRVRERAALTQEELARRSGVGRATIAGLETGSRRAQPRTIQRLAGAIGVDPNELVELEASPAKRPEIIEGERGMPFTAVYQRDGEWWMGFVEELPGANAQGETLSEARESLREAVELVLEANRELTRREFEGGDVVREPLKV